jgi:hypothetical protein
MVMTSEVVNGRIIGDIYRRLIREFEIKMTEYYDSVPAVLSINGIPIATLGNFSASVGKAKSKKTFNVSAIAAAALCDHEVLNYTGSLPAQKNKVLYIDTEQGKFHCSKVLRRIAEIADLPLDKECDRLRFFALRNYTPEQRRDIIETTLSENSDIGLVIIDGVRDLLHDINSPSESVDVINDLMRWSGCYGLHIHTVLHANKADDNTRGHLGTELNNKAETILQVVKLADNSSASMVKPMHVRDKEFAPFIFEIGDDSLPHLSSGQIKESRTSSKKTGFMQFNIETHRTALSRAFAEIKVQGYNSLLERVRDGYSSIGYPRGRNTIVKLVKYLLECGAIKKGTDGYSYDANFSLQSEAASAV